MLFLWLISVVFRLCACFFRGARKIRGQNRRLCRATGDPGHRVRHGEDRHRLESGGAVDGGIDAGGRNGVRRPNDRPGLDHLHILH